MATELTELALAYEKASKRRATLKRCGRIAAIFGRLDNIDASIAALEQRVAETRGVLQAANRARKMSNIGPRHGGTPKDRSATQKSTSHQKILDRLQDAQSRRAACEKELDRDQEWREVTRAYYAARHALLAAIADREGQLDPRTRKLLHPTWGERKLRFLMVAGFDADEVSDVWIDATSDAPREVNLFYGGADVPDGIGHGHVVLEWDEPNRRYNERWRRQPRKEPVFAEEP